MAPKTNAEHQAAYRARKAAADTPEVRGIFAHVEDHEEIKIAATRIVERRSKTGHALERSAARVSELKAFDCTNGRTSLAAIGLKKQALEELQKAGVTTVEGANAMSDIELLRLRRIGRVALKNIRQVAIADRMAAAGLPTERTKSLNPDDKLMLHLAKTTVLPPWSKIQEVIGTKSSGKRKRFTKSMLRAAESKTPTDFWK